MGCSTPNNTGTLSGAAIGQGKSDNSALVKIVPVTVTMGRNYSVSDASITKSSSSYYQLTSLAFSVTNTGNQIDCFVSISQGLAGKWNFAQYNSYVNGTVGKVENVSTSTCLGPCETGYLLASTDDTSVSPASIDSVSITFAAPRTGTFLPGARVQPESYSYDADEGLTVQVENLGERVVIVNRLSFYVLLDEAGHVPFWGLIRLAKTLDTVALVPSFLVALYDDSLVLRDWAGSVSKLTAFIDFDAWTSDRALSLAPSREVLEKQAEVVAQRTRLRDLLSR